MPTASRAMAYIGVVVGLGISTTINVMHATRASSEWWAPWLDGSWPVLLFIALEVLTRTKWGSGSARYVAWAGVGGLALVAGTESYWNLRDMMIGAHKEVWLATIGPLGVDGLMAACAAALLVDDEPTHGPAETPVDQPTTVTDTADGPAHVSHEVPTGPSHLEPMDHPTGPSQSENVQATAQGARVGRPKAPVSQEAIDKVLTAVQSGQPMGKSAIIEATGLGRSTAGRAVDHLVQVGRLTTIGEPHRPSYVLTQCVTHKPAQPVTHDSGSVTQ